MNRRRLLCLSVLALLGSCLSSHAGLFDFFRPKLQSRTYTLEAEFPDKVRKNLKLKPGAPLDYKAWFARHGVAWPKGAKITAVPEKNQLIVVNTGKNIERINKVILHTALTGAPPAS